jgi:hypothetical protein
MTDSPAALNGVHAKTLLIINIGEWYRHIPSRYRHILSVSIHPFIYLKGLVLKNDRRGIHPS